MHKIFLFGLFLFIWQGTTYAEPVDGKKLYSYHCSACHSVSGKGGIGLPLSTSSIVESFTDEYVRKTIRNGRPGRIMPAFTKLSDEEVEAIISYIRTWGEQKVSDSPTPILGNPANGRETYNQYCAVCHQTNLEGSAGTGVTFSRKREFPIMPPALNNPGFLSAASDEMIKYIITNGRKDTPMPAFGKLLNEPQINDLISFIRSSENTQQTQTKEQESAVIVYESPHNFAETVKRLREAISAYNFRTFQDRYVEQGLTDEFAVNKKQVIIRFCNFAKLYKVLNIEPRLGTILPCKITVIEDEDGTVKLIAANIKALGSLFNNKHLEKMMDEIHSIYEEILDEVTI